MAAAAAVILEACPYTTLGSIQSRYRAAAHRFCFSAQLEQWRYNSQHLEMHRTAISDTGDVYKHRFNFTLRLRLITHVLRTLYVPSQEMHAANIDIECHLPAEGCYGSFLYEAGSPK